MSGLTEKEEAFLAEYEALCRKHEIIVDTVGFEHGNDVLLSVCSLAIDGHLDEVRDIAKEHRKKRSKN